MSKNWKKLGKPSRAIVIGALAGLSVVAVYLYRLGTLTNGATLSEVQNINFGLGTTGIIHNPLFLPIQLLRSGLIFIVGPHNLFVDRLPDVFFGLIAIACFSYLIWLWHDARTTVFAAILFAFSPWVLHVSRVASFDVMYLLVAPLLLLTHVLLHRYNSKPFVFIATLASWSILMYIPGVIWLLLWNIYLQRSDIKSAWLNCSGLLKKTFALVAGLLWVPLVAELAVGNIRILTYLGAPSKLDSATEMAKHAASVPYHLFVVGPEYPAIWLGHSPILNIFCLVMCILGIYYYLDHWSASRSKLLISISLIALLLVALNGPATISLLVPLLYVFVAMGIAFILNQWLKIFPLNPLARSIGIGILALAVGLSAIYGLRSYFVAWPANQTSIQIFRYHP